MSGADRKRARRAMDPVLAALIDDLTIDDLPVRLPQLRDYIAGITDPLQREGIHAVLTAKLEDIGVAAPARTAGAVMASSRPNSAAKVDDTVPQAQQLADLASDAELFHSADGDSAFATVRLNGHRETWPVRSRGFKDWVLQRFYQSQKRPPSAQSLSDALALLEARARIEGAAADIFLRVAPHDGGIVLDLGTPDHRAVEITRTDWKVVDDPAVKFVRSRGMLALPVPVLGGSIDELWRFANVRPDDRPLFAGALLMAYNPQGPYPVTVLHGSEGTAKSTTARVFQRLVDPNQGDLRAEPREVRDLAIAVSNTWLAAFDNLSSVVPWFSDCLCRLSTGAGFATRELYSDRGEVIIAAQRPVIVTGIEEICTRADLLSRAVIIHLPEIHDKDRRDEKVFWSDFERARPRLLGAIFTAVAEALRGRDTVQLAGAPRLADFARFVVAGEAALGMPRGAFLAAYRRNVASGNDLALEASAIAPHIQALATALGSWEGTSQELLAALNARVEETVRKSRSWPKSPKAISNAVRRIVANLRASGVDVSFENRPELEERRRQIIIRRTVGAANDRSDRSDGSGAGFNTADRNGAERSERPFTGPSPGTCSACGGDDFWRSGATNQLVCRRCHPPAPGVEAAR